MTDPTHLCSPPECERAGTAWGCSCGQWWVSTGLDLWAGRWGWRRERWWERRRRLRRDT